MRSAEVRTIEDRGLMIEHRKIQSRRMGGAKQYPSLLIGVAVVARMERQRNPGSWIVFHYIEATALNTQQMENWSTGVLEYWIWMQYSVTPALHYSSQMEHGAKRIGRTSAR